MAAGDSMRVFITGASGFIGARVTRALLSAGYEVAVLAVPGDPLKRLADVAERLTLLRGDLAALQDIRPQLAAWGPDACIHLAWYAEPGKYLHAPENIPALSRSLELLNLLVEIGCRQIVMAGTCAEYDTDYGFLREDGPTRPTTIYAATKLSLKIIAEQIAASKGVNFIWGRIFYLYGPDEDERRVVPALIKSLLAGKPFPATKGDQVRDYLHVDDIANAFLTLVKTPVSGTYNISSAGTPAGVSAVVVGDTIHGHVAGLTDIHVKVV